MMSLSGNKAPHSNSHAAASSGRRIRQTERDVREIRSATATHQAYSLRMTCSSPWRAFREVGGYLMGSSHTEFPQEDTYVTCRGLFLQWADVQVESICRAAACVTLHLQRDRGVVRHCEILHSKAKPLQSQAKNSHENPQIKQAQLDSLQRINAPFFHLENVFASERELFV